MNDEMWAQISLRISSQRLTVSEIEQLMAGKSTSKRDHLWSIDLTEDSAVGLNEQLEIAKCYLRDKASAIEKIVDSEVNISISWTPRNPQDGIILDAEMIALLARLRCYVLLDTYAD